jgi:hypothetical protein
MMVASTPSPVHACDEVRVGTPDAGNPHVRCDEGLWEASASHAYSTAFAREFPERRPQAGSAVGAYVRVRATTRRVQSSISSPFQAR